MKQFFAFFKKLAKKKSFWIVFIIAVIVIIYLSMTAGEETIYAMEKVQRGDLIQTVSETGTIESSSAINLNFRGLGTLVDIRVQEGDEVKAGKILARLDAGSLGIAVRQAQANLDMARANLNKLLVGVSTEDLKVTEETVSNAKISADNAQMAFNDIEAQSAQSISNARQNLINEINRQVVICRSTMDVIDEILDNNYLTNQFSVKNPQYGIDAHNYYDEAERQMVVTDTSVSNLNINNTEENLSDALAKLNNTQTWIKNALDKTYLGLINTLVGNLYTEALYNADKAKLINEQNIINAGISSLAASDQNYINSQLSQDSSYTQAKANLDSALGAYNLAKAQYDLKKAPPRQVDIDYYQAQVDQARAAYDLALKNLDDYIIYAPTDGVVTFVNYKKGEQIGSGLNTKPVIAMIGKGDFQIKVDVPESNIVKIKVGNEARLTLDAYGSDVIFTGKVVTIDIAETVIQGVVYYKTTVQLDETENELKSGMTANVDIITATVENALYLPNRAIKQDTDGQRYVEILKSEGIEETFDIEVGIRADIGTEIKSGLEEGQEVIVSKKKK